MQTQHQAQQARDAAMHRAEIGSGEHWQDLAFTKFTLFLDCLEPGEKFLSEQVRVWSHLDGLEEPEDNRAWGPVINRGVREKLIVKIGYAPSATGHCRPMPVWSKV